jgi:hypothetical protein
MVAVEDRHADETEGKGQHHCYAEKKEVGWTVIGGVGGQWSFLRNSVGGRRLDWCEVGGPGGIEHIEKCVLHG